MPRYKLRTLLILLAVLPPVLAFGWWCYGQWRAEQERGRVMAEMIEESRLRNQLGLRQLSLRAINQMQNAPPGRFRIDLSYRKSLRNEAWALKHPEAALPSGMPSGPMALPSISVPTTAKSRECCR